MQEIEAKGDGSQPGEQYDENTPSGLLGLEKEAPEDANAGKPDKQENEPHTSENLRTLAFWSLWGGIAAWIQKDTSATDWLIVILTAVIAGTSYLQWREIRNGSTDTHTLAQAAKTQADRMKDFVDRMKEQTDRTKDLADQAIKQTYAQLGQLKEIRDTDRAFVFVWNVETVIGPAINGEKAYSWTVAFDNSGTTPTKDLTLAISCGFGGQFGSPIDPTKAAPGFHAMIGPKSSQIVPSQCSALSRLVEQEKTNGWYVFGYAKYRDVFKEQHLTEFCWQNRRYINPNEEPHMAPCTDAGAAFNCVDKECADYDKLTKQQRKPS